MQVPLQITFRDMDHSAAIEERIQKKAHKLEQYSDRIIACQVVVESTQRHQQHGKLYNVRIHMTLPKKEIMIKNNENTDVYTAIRDAFDDATRQLEEETHRRQGEVKNHAAILNGHIVRIFPVDGFGFIEDELGEEFYFNSANVVHPAFERLEIGMPVHFIGAAGDEGLQARRVSAK